MSRLLLYVRVLPLLAFAVIFTALLVQSFSLSSQTSSFSLLLDLDESEGDQVVQSLDVSPNQDFSIQIFSTGMQSKSHNDSIRSASHLSVRFEYDTTQVVYKGFDAGDVLSNPDVMVSEGTNPTTVSGDSTSTFLPHDGTSFVEIHITSLDSSATINSHLVGTIRFRTTVAFLQTEIRLVRAELDRDGQVESAVLNVRVALQVTAPSSPDFDGSGFVDLQDFLLFSSVFGFQEGQEGYEKKYDLNGDGKIGSEDYVIYLQSYGKWMNRAPVFTSEPYVRRFIDENTPGGEPIGDPITATDADDDILTYGLSGIDVDLFVIDSRTGQIQTKEGITYDYEHRTTYSVIVEVSDTQRETAHLLVIIKINDLKEPPSSPPSNFWVRPDNESLTVHFSAVSDEQGKPPVRGYHAEIRRGENGPWGTRKTIYGRNNTSVYYHHIDPEGYHSRILVNGQVYQVRVRAWNSEGASDWSAPVSGIPVYTPPKERPQLAQFQSGGDAIVDLSPFTGAGGKIIVPQAALPATISQEEVEGIFIQLAKVAVSNAPDVPAQAGFTLTGSSSLCDIDLMARVNNQDVDIGDALRTSVEICLPVPEDISDPVIVHYEEGEGTWEMLERQRVDNDVVCGYTDVFSLFGVGLLVNRTPVVVGRFETQTLRVGDEGVTIDVSGKFSDPDEDVLTYGAASSDEAVAKVDVSGSVVTITPVAEGTATITVTARDVAGSNQTAEQTIAVTVNKADVKLSFGGATVPAQTYTVGTQIDAIQLPEATGGTGTIGYTLTPSLPDGLVMDEETRTISGTPTVALESRDYKWKATDKDENTIELVFSITVKPANQVPIFSEGASTTRSFAENTAAGQNIGQPVVAIDNDGGTPVYNLQGDDADSFDLVTDSGQLHTKNGVTYNYEVKNSYSVVVGVVDGQGGSATIAVTVTVNDVTEPPGKPSAPTLAEATFNSLKISWSVPTNTGPQISSYDVRYILSSASAEDKADDSKWTVVTDAWTSGDLEYTISPLLANTGYDIQVLAESDEGMSEWSDTREGTTSANAAPVIADISPISVNENSTADIVTVVATDEDAGDNITRYGIADGADGDQFSIVADTGVLTFKDAPNFEDPQDVAVTDPSNDANNNEYIVYVTATGGTGDRALTASDTITVTVTDVDEPPGKPSAPTIAAATFNSLKIGWTAPTNTGPSITAYDVRYILSSASAADKADDSKWTVVTDAWTSGDGDLEYTITSLEQGEGYDIQVLAESDEGIGDWSDTREGMTVQNAAPVIADISPISVNENSTADIVTVVATDADAGDNITRYGIADGADGGQFSIVADTGVLTFKVAPNYEAPTDVEVTDPSNAAGNNEYVVYVTATSGENARTLTARKTVIITVTDVAEPPGKPAVPVIAEATFNSLKISWSVPTNTGPQISSYDVRYILSSASAADKADDSKWTEVTDAWTSDPGGTLEYTITGLEQGEGYDIQVLAESDEGMSEWSDTREGMTAENAAPVIADISPISVNENSTADIVTVVATDADAGDNITRYGIADGADGDQFSIVADTGVLTFKVAPNYEVPTDVEVTDPSNVAANNEYIVIVSVTSGEDARTLTARKTVIINVTDVAEQPGKPAVPVIAEATFNSLKISWSVPTNTGPQISSYDVRYILSSASAADKADDSKWTEVTDAWTSGDLEYTISPLLANTGYDIQVLAESDEGMSEWSDTREGTTSANAAPVIADISPISVNENSTADIVTVVATDEDAGDNITRYGIADGADGDQFSIVADTGVLTFKDAPNFEDPQDVAVTDPSNDANNNEYIVIVTAIGGTGDRALTARDTITVTVIDVDEPPGKPSAPTLAEATFNSLKISWTAPTNTGPEISSYDVRYILSSASAADKADDSKWTEVTDAWTSGDGDLEYTITGLEQGEGYDIQVLAESDEGMSEWSDTREGMTVQNAAPVIADISPISVNENSTADIVTVVATDADAGDNITRYGIADGADGDQFSIVADTGVLTFKVAPNYEVPTDVEVTDPSNVAANNEYIVIVSVTSGEDARTLTARKTVIITVTDVDEPPGKPSAPTIAEATFNSLKISWTAPTNTGPSITAYDVRYILSSASAADKADDSKWTVVTDAWTSGDLEYTISPLLANTGYDIQVLAESDEGMSEWSDTREGMTSANVAPVITLADAVSVAENSTADIVTVVATDADAGDNITRYGIADGADGDQFSIVADTGVLTFKVAPNYEMPTDVEVTDPPNAAGNNEYVVYVTATSGENARTLTARKTVIITVTDVDEPPGKPSAPTIAEATFNSLKISWTAPTNTGPSITAYDVRYILSSASAADKADDSKWTVVTDAWTSGDLEYTISPLLANTGYDIQVLAESDEGMSEWSDTREGMTSANVAPVITLADAVSVAENSTADIVTVVATDADAGDNITRYGIADGADGDQFSIVADTGVLTFKVAPNYEMPTDVEVTDPPNAAGNNEYVVYVTATSGENARTLTARKTVIITVTDVDEPPGKPSAPTIAAATFNSLKISWATPTNTGPSITAYDVRYILSSASSEDKADNSKWTQVTDAWTSDPGGTLEYTITGLEQGEGYDIQVLAESDEGMSEWSDTREGTTSANAAPVIADISPISVNENSTADIVTVVATDADAGDNITRYGIADGADGGQFSIVADTGVLTFKVAPNYEAPTDVEVTDPSNAASNNEYIVIVSVTSGDNARALTASDTLTVTVTDVAERPGKPAIPVIAEATFNSLKISWSVPTNTGPQISSYDVRYILSSASAADKGDDSKWTEVTDAWTSGDGGTLEYTIGSLLANTGYDIQVLAESDEGMSEWSDTREGMTAENAAPVIADISPISVNENSTADIVTVVATDEDAGDNITRYGIADGADGDQFSIVADTGVLTFKVAPNYEAPTDVEVTDPSNAVGNNEYIVIVTATSGEDARTLTARKTVIITVTDVDEPPGKPAVPVIAEATFNSLKISWSVPTNTGPQISSYDVRYILSSASAADKADDSKWTEVTDAWTSGDGDLEYTITGLEQGEGYDIQVLAESDEGMSEWSDTREGTTSANAAPVIADISPISVNENSTADIVTVTAMDADDDDNITGYGIADGADGDQFSIVASTGVLTFKVAPNYEAPTDVEVTDPSNAAANNEYIVIVSVTSGEDARALTASDTLTVTVTDVAERPGKPAIPTLAEATFNSLKISWTAPTNTGPSITAYDVRYILSSASAEDKADDSKWTQVTDAWTSDPGGDLEYTIGSLLANTGYDIQVLAESDEGMSEWSDTREGMTAENAAPVIADISPISVNENSTADIVTVVATDADAGDNITRYGIADGADGDQFSIVADTGVLTFKDAPNFEDPQDVAVTDPSNDANNNEYIVIVTAIGGTGDRALTARDTITVTVIDVDEPPGKPSAPTLAEATFNSLKISWTAPTNTGPSITAYDVRYILSSASAADKADDSKWTEVTDAWTSGDGDLEYTITGLEQGEGYDIQVLAESDEGMSPWSDTREGMTAENAAPVIADISPISVNENSTADIVTVVATDEDAGDNITRYGIADGADGDQFSIVASTGVLTFKVAPNYEAPTDVEVTDPSNAASNNEYIVIVSVTSGEDARTLTARKTVIITVTDVDEPPGKPSAPTIAEATFNSLKISWSVPTNTGPQISSYDVRYILSNASAADKADDSKWTEVEDVWTSDLGGTLEYTISPLLANTGYDIQVLAESDEGMSQWSDTREGMTSANAAPVIADISPISVNENSTADIVTVMATDEDAGDNITRYGIADGADGDQFSIVAATGVLTFKASPNYEVPTDVEVTAPSNAAANNEYIVIVSVTSGEDARTLTARKTVIITVTDVDEPPGKPAVPVIAEATFNSLKISWSVPTNTGPQISSYDVRYILSNASAADKADDSKWTEVEDVWTSDLGGTLEYTISPLLANTGYDIQVLAESDEGMSEWSDTREGTTSANAAPVIADISPISVNENSTADIVTVVATDADAGDNITRYGIADGADGDQFSIVAATGVLTFKVAPNYEVPTDVEVTDPSNAAGNNEYIVIVSVTSGEDARTLTARKTVIINVTDVAERPGKPAIPVIAEATFNSLKISWTAPTNTGPSITAYDVRYILSSASETDKADDSKWTEVTDAWTSDPGGTLEYTITGLEQGEGYDIQVLAESDEGMSEWSDTREGTTSANAAPVIADISPISVNENSTADIVTVVATDADAGDNITRYGIADGADGDQFSIVASTGVLTFKVAPNYEVPTDVEVTDPSNVAANNEYIVIVSVTSGEDARTLTARKTVIINVTDVAEQPGKPAMPTLAEATFNSLKISWSVPTNTGPQISSYDVRYILSSASAADKADDSKWTEVTDAWTSDLGGTLEYTISPLLANTGYDIQVLAESDEGMSEWSDTREGMTAENAAPVIADISPISVNENSTADIVTVVATDADAGDNITRYGIADGADGDQFSIVASTGVLTFKVAPNYEVPTDVEVTDPSNVAANNEYIVIVSVTSGEDARTLTARKTVIINVTDVAERPGKPAIPVIAEATFNSLKISWTAPTNTGPSITAYDVRYILSSASETDKADDSKWTEVTDAWTSDPGGTLEYTITGLEQGESYDIQVLAESDEGMSEWSDTREGTTSANAAPVIADISPISVNENSTADIVTVVATDADAGDNITRYGIADGADGDQFSIVASTGVLTFKASPNYEAPTDVEVTDPSNAAANNEYIVIVSVTSGEDARALTASDTLTVTVTDVAERPGKPAIPTLAEATFNSLKISWTAPTNTGPSITAYDVRYILSSASAEDKADDSKWTQVTDAWTSDPGGDLEYTIGSLLANTGYDIQVLAESDEGMSEWSDTREGMTAENAAPVIADISPISVNENSTADIVTVVATDADAGDNITRYGIADGADGDQFSIVADTGVLTFKVAPNYEVPTDVEVTDPSNVAANNEYIVIVSVTSGEDARTLTARKTVIITVTDVDEPPGKPSAPTLAEATFNSLKISWSVPTNTGPQISSYDVRYILSSASAEDKADDSKWTVVTDAWTSGDLEYTISPLLANTGYDIQVLAESDEGMSEWSDTREGTTSANAAPVIADISPISVNENSTADIVTVVATDADAGDNITRYGIADGADGDQFSIVADTGVLTFKDAPNFEDPQDVAVTDPSNDANNNEYIVIVTAIGGTGDRALTARDTITVTVIDVDEPPGKPAVPVIAEATFNSLKISWSVPTNTGPQISSYDVRYILSSASAADKADDSKWTEVTDAWTSGDGDLEYTITGLEQGEGYDIQVLAESDEGMSPWSDTREGMTVQNAAPVIADISPISVNENSTGDVATVTAMDADDDDNITGYGIASGADGAQFSIVADTGVLTFKVAPNYEAPTDVEVTDPSNAAGNNEYVVYVTATSGENARTLTARKTVIITVTDVDEPPGKPSAPTIAAATFNSLKISWATPTNTGPSITAYDVRYILSNASAEDKADDSKWTEVEDVWTSDLGGTLEYTISPLLANTGYDIQVLTESDEGMSEWSDTREGMTSANVAPVITLADAVSVAENSTADIVTVVATDEDAGDNITRYGIADGADGDQFSIVADTGVLTFKVAPNYEMPTDVEVTDPPNAAGNNEYVVYVTATSGENARTLTARKTVIITVTDVDEPPGKPSAPTIAAATFNSLKISWATPTNTGPSITAYDVRYILSSASAADKADDSKWTEVTDAWTSDLGGTLEYTITGLEQGEGYDIQVLAESDEGMSEWSDTREGMTAENAAPVIADISPISVNENSTADIVTVVATDADAGDNITRYGIADGADGDQFSIVASTGVLTFKVAPNYEVPTDVEVTDPSNVAANNEYIVIVSVTSGEDARTLTARKTVIINVTDVAERPGKPAIPVIAEATFNSLKISWTAPTNTGPSITAYDVRYILSSASETDKADDSKWTEVTDAWTSDPGGTLEYTITGLEQGESYDIQVLAESDEGMSEWSDTREGTTSANAAPVIADISPISVNENSTADIVTVVATDADAGDNITRYGIADGADGDQFSIVASTGVLTFKASPNYEAPTDVEVTDPSNAAGNNEYIVIVSVTSGEDARTLTASDTLTVTVTDVAEQPGKPAMPTLAEATFNSLKISWTAPTNTGPEIESYDVRYILSSASAEDKADNSKWTQVEHAWRIGDGGDLEYTITGLEQGEGYDIQVLAGSAEGLSPWSDTREGMTRASVAPVIADISPISVNENSTVSLVTVSATDPDEDDDIESYGIADGADGDQFSIVAATGVLTFKVAPNYEAPTDVEVTDPSNAAANNEYIVYVTATSGEDARTLTARKTVIITVTDVDEPPGKPAIPVIAEATFDGLKIRWTAPTNTGPSITAYDVRYILSSASAEDKADDSKWTQVTDAWTSDPGGDLEYTIGSLLANTYDIQVLAESDEGMSEWSDTREGTITLQDYDEDGDGLIEVSTFTQLNAIRYDLNGNGQADKTNDQTNYTSAFPNATSNMGCYRESCEGYELTTDLDFNNSSWTTGQGWEPIGTSSNRFTAIFDGGGNTLSNLFIDRAGDAGLFGYSSGSIKNVGLVNVNLVGTGKVGGLLGRNNGDVANCFVTGQVSSTDTAGGLVGANTDTIRTSYSRANVVNTLNGGGFAGVNEDALLACYATGTVSTARNAGGLVGWNPNSASIKYCYATGSVSSSGTGDDGRRVGGFMGGLQAPWGSRVYGRSYWDTQTTGQSSRAGSRFVSASNHEKIRSNIIGKTTSELQSPTGYSGIYGRWNDEDVTGDGRRDAPWDFGTSSQYPILKVDFNGDGTATSHEFGSQRVLGRPTISSATLAGQRLTVQWGSPADKGNSTITAYDMRYVYITEDESIDNNWTVENNAWTSGTLTYSTTVMQDFYAIQVRAKNSEGTGPWSETAYAYSTALSSTWTNFVLAKRRGTEPILPDFSYAGYHYFSKPVPDVTHPIFDVTEYGAIANDNKSDQSAIQAAIDAAVSNGSGIVYFPAGEFLVNTDSDNNTPIYIRGSNIVLRGEGSRTGGTIIRQVNDMPASSPTDRESPAYMFNTQPSGSNSELTTITEDANRETFWITVADASMLSVGQWIELRMNSNDAVSDFLHPYSPLSVWTRINDNGIAVREKHSIAEIDGNRIRLREPLHVLKVDTDHGWQVHSYTHLEEVGIEDISFQGSFLENFVHHKNPRHNSGWGLIKLDKCVNSWIRRVSFINISRLRIESCAAVSIYHVTVAGNKSHYYVKNQRNYGVWFGLSEDLAGQLHGINSMSQTVGTVYYRFDLQRNQPIDLHTLQPYSNLYDKIRGGRLSGSGGSRASYPNHLRHLVFWNLNHRNNESNHFDFWTGGTPYVVKPIIVGLHGNQTSFNTNSLELLESNGMSVDPESLFEAQLELRLGRLPSWLSTLKSEWTALKNRSLTIPTTLADNILVDHSLETGVDVTIDVKDNFLVLHNETLSYSALSSNTTIATVSVNGSDVTITGVWSGNATITVTATASGGSIAQHKFNVTVVELPVFVTPLDQELTVSWEAAVGSIEAYDVRYILSSASAEDKAEDTNWTLVEDVWTTRRGGNFEYTISGLINDMSYDVQVGAKTTTDGLPFWSSTMVGIPTSVVDYDEDGDGLIEVSTFTQLNAIRYDLNGNGQADKTNDQTNYTSAFPNATSNMGCYRESCEGYELTTDLDFNNSSWTTGQGWEPIGTSSNRFTAIFDGGGNTLSNLFIDRAGDAGLFGYSSGSIKNVGLVNVNLVGTGKVGGLLGRNNGDVANCFVTGQVSSTDTAGGLVGANTDTIRTSYSRANVVNTLNGGGFAGVNEDALLACYATGTVSTARNAGGLVGWNPNSASIKYCYATGSVSSSGTGDDGRRVGGFMGGLQAPWGSRVYGRSYWDTQTTGQSSRAGSRFVSASNHEKIRSNIIGKTTSELQSPTGYSGIYGRWNDEDVTGDGRRDAPWDFGTSSQYPILKVDFNGDGTATSHEFGSQR